MEGFMEEVFEDDFVEVERGLLSEINSVSDYNEIVFPNPVDDGTVDSEVVDDEIVINVYGRPGGMDSTRKMSKPAVKKISLLGYLGTVKMERDEDGKVVYNYNPRAWLLQTMLNELGYPTEPDGKFGPKTDEQVKKFQEKNNLVVDGAVGPKSWKKLILLGRSGISNSTISNKDYEAAATTLGVEVEVVKAIKDVESGPSGSFLFSNHPTILFEGHVFWERLDTLKAHPESFNDSDILYPKWNNDHYVSGVAEYVRLQKARDINIDAANASASWGLFQIMGKNFEACGCGDVSEFVKRMRMSEGEQLQLFVNFIKYHHMDRYLRPGKIQWAEFAKRYNGASYWKHGYHTRLQKAYENYKG